MNMRSKIKLFSILGILVVGLGIFTWAALTGKITFQAEVIQKYGSLKGTVTDLHGKPFDGGEVIIAFESTSINTDGSFEFKQLPIGYYPYYVYSKPDQNGKRTQYVSYLPENMVYIKSGENTLDLEYLYPYKEED